MSYLLKLLGGQSLTRRNGANLQGKCAPMSVPRRTRRRMRDSFVAVDLETTGLSPYRDRIVEIGAIKVIEGEIERSFASLVNPGVSIPSRVIKIHGITNEMVRDAPKIEEVLPSFLEFIYDYPLVAHNAGFDIGFLKRSALSIDRTIENEVVDTLQICRRLFPELGNHKLSTVAEYLSVEGEDMHRALNDCFYVANIYLCCSETVSPGNQL